MEKECVSMKEKRRTAILFALYGLILIWIVLFKMSFSLEDILMLRTERSVNWIPFHYAAEVGQFHKREVFLNVLIFIPVGIWLKMFAIPTRKAAFLGLLSSLALETCQFLFAIGASDITDLLTNTLGTAVGVCLYALLRKLFPNKQKTDRFLNTAATAALLLFTALTALLFLANIQ